MPSKRKYRNNLGFVEQGFRACWQNAQDLVAAASQLLDRGLHASALSISVLALEELGKLYALDGLLYARADDAKIKTFKDAMRSHDTKLDILVVLPMLLGSLVRSDSRYGDDKAFMLTTAISLRQLETDGKAVLDRAA